MNVARALEQLSEIHGHLARTETYRGCRPGIVALTAAFAIVAGIAQPSVVPHDAPLDFVRFWVSVAILNLVMVSVEMAWNHFFNSTPASRRITAKVLGQFVPCVAAGAVVTVLVVRAGTEPIPMLPGLWAMIFALGVFSARPYLPRAIGWVGLLYLVAGGGLLHFACNETSLAAWGMAGTFGLGQLATAFVLRQNFARCDHA